MRGWRHPWPEHAGKVRYLFSTVHDHVIRLNRRDGHEENIPHTGGFRRLRRFLSGICPIAWDQLYAQRIRGFPLQWSNRDLQFGPEWLWWLPDNYPQRNLQHHAEWLWGVNDYWAKRHLQHHAERLWGVKDHWAKRNIQHYSEWLRGHSYRPSRWVRHQLHAERLWRRSLLLNVGRPR